MDLPVPSSVWLERVDGAPVPVVGNCALGRSASNAVTIADPRVSRHHATIHAQDEGEYWLIDLGSSNGTQLNARRVVQPQRLKDGDRIVIADAAFVFRQTAAATEESASGALPTVQEVRQETRWLVLADIEGFTPLSQRLTPDELATLVGQWLRGGREVVEAHGGAVNKYLGDGWLACWPGEAADAVCAVVAALRERSVAAAPRFRVIVHHGTVAIGGAAAHGEEYLLGPEVNFIFRVEKVAASAGAAFCFTEAAYRRLGATIDLEPIPGRHELKGFPGDYEIFAWARAENDAD
jgi:adenylate cyclase